MSKKYFHSIIGGTFDHLHIGHEHFLRAALSNSEKITVGLTTELLHVHKEFSGSIQDFETRHDNIMNFCTQTDPTCDISIIPLSDIYGTSLMEREIDAIFVTEHGLENARIINKKRNEKGWKELHIEKIDLVYGNDGKIVSSTRMRSGEIDRQGNNYLKFFAYTKVLPEHLRSTLGQPLGEVLEDDGQIQECLRDTKYIFAVGDMTTQKLLSLNIRPIVSLIDLKTQRRDIEGLNIEYSNEDIVNQPGEINTKAVRSLSEKIKNGITQYTASVYKISGEEDLLALPLILLTPIGSIVCYGQRGEGMVVVRVNEDIKLKVLGFIEKFENLS